MAAEPVTGTGNALPLRERLRQRQAALVHRSSVLRERLAVHGRALAPLWQGAQAARRGWQWVRAHPWMPALAALALLARRPRRLWGAALLGWRAWRLWRRYGVMVARWWGPPKARGWAPEESPRA